MLFSAFRQSTYEPLSTYPGQQQQKRWSTRSKLALGFAVASTVLLGFWFGKAALFRRAYNPLDDYRNINQLPVTVADSLPKTSPSNRRAVVSSLYSDDFAIATAVVGYSTQAANVSARLLLPYLSDRVSSKALCIAQATGWEPYPVPLIPPPHDGRGIYARFMDQYTKLNIWKLDSRGIDSAVYLDADTLVRRNFDELFDSPFNFAAVPDVYGAGDPRGFSLTFNAGVLAFRPSSAVFDDMREKMETAEFPLKQAEQAFLNLYFGGTAMRLPYVYNANLAIKVRSPVLWRRLVDEMRVVHYTTVKPFIIDSKSSSTILDEKEIRVAMEQAAKRESGLFREEVGWWREAYDRMMLDRGHEIRKCY
ncbi:glycosyltransferase family 8 protein [Roridomyces roridus]|uniref:Glycosyltransferase family 8 protein n=1 Tax=Roridomyces roridus TaxID=1738132 RepID=A0AAD7CAB1_9AGAR|nr:glycosyltransferase family 8 protein [Roridomyces roridus]